VAFADRLQVFPERYYCARRPIVLGREIYLESRESPTRIDPLLAAGVGGELLDRGTGQLQASSDLQTTDFTRAGDSQHADSSTFSNPSESQQPASTISLNSSVQSASLNVSHSPLWGSEQLSGELSSVFNVLETPFDSTGKLPSHSALGQAMDLALLASSWNAAKDSAESSSAGRSEPGASAPGASGPIFLGGSDLSSPSISPGFFLAPVNGNQAPPAFLLPKTTPTVPPTLPRASNNTPVQFNTPSVPLSGPVTNANPASSPPSTPPAGPPPPSGPLVFIGPGPDMIPDLECNDY